MSSQSAKVILQAHATRSATALTLLLHARDRSPRDAKSPWAPIIVGFVISLLILVVTAIAIRVGALIDARH